MLSRFSFISVLVLAFIFVSAAEAATFTVTKTADTADGVCNTDCSFREAIIAANQNGSGADTINFDIPGTGVKTILLTSEIPHLQSSVTINGHTQTGYFGKPLIELRGNSTVPEALHLITPNPPVPISVTIYALAINSFSTRGLLSSCLLKCDLTVKGSFIGTDPTGAIDMGNGRHGVEVMPSPDSIVTIGGSGLDGNVISGNGAPGTSGSGIMVRPPPMDDSDQGNLTVNIVGNKIGTDFNGNVDLGNRDGVYVTERSENGSFHAFTIELNVGGSAAGTRNVISGNDGTGIYANVTKATIKGNFIGVNGAGIAAMGNVDPDDPDDGIYILPHPNGVYQIGGTGATDGNVISSNGSSGIEIDTYVAFAADDVPVSILGNKIGTNAAGTADLGNGREGIRIGKIPNLNLDVVIGGLGNAPNLISGNGTHGIAVNGEKVRIYANKIGTNIDGTAKIANTNDGISLIPFAEAIDVTVGGSVVLDGITYDLGNLVSGNDGGGITFDGNSAAYSPVNIRRNRIGTNAAGTAALGNTGSGIFVKDAGAMIGSSAIAADGNVISGNGNSGIMLMGDPGAHPSEVYGNKIGTNGIGGSPIPNDDGGITINGSKNNKIGMAGNAAAVNVISGNNGPGVSLTTQYATDNQVLNNLIGTGPANNDLGNAGAGISFSGGSTGNFIGSSTSGAGNTIAYNLRGIWVVGGADNEFRRNAIYSNDELGIDLGTIGVTPNDPGDSDTGGNRLQNFPVLGRVTPAAIKGTLNSNAAKNFTIDFYRAESCDANGHGEGRYFIGSTVVVTDASGNASFDFPVSLTLGQPITATATVTDVVGADDTSEFSQCKVVTPAPSVAFSLSAYSVNEGGGSRTITVNRSGATDGVVTVDYATSNGTATAGVDYTAASGSLVFADGETIKTFNVEVSNDNLDEPDETINLTLSNPGGGAGLGANATSVLTISDNDPTPAISITNVTANEGHSGNTSFTFNLSLSSPSAQTVGVHLETEDVSATPWVDFLPFNTNLTFAPNEMNKSVTVLVVGDTTPEPDETFLLMLSTPTNATIGTQSGIATIVNDDNVTPPSRTTFDYDGDGRSDISVYRPSNGQWWLNRSSAGVLAMTFGSETDKIVPADYTGDGKTDVAFWRPSTGDWFVLRSEDSSYFAFPFGASTDIPMPADYDGDGKADPAVFRPSNATWYIQKSSGGILITSFGATGDVPVADDYDGDGKADLAIYRPSNGQWWLNRTTAGVLAVTFGTSTDKPIHGDFTGGGKADIAFWRPSTGDWFVLRSEDSSYYGFPFGASGDIASAADFDGDGKSDPAIFRPSNATWFINRSTDGILIQAFGANGDLPTQAAFVP